MHHKHSVFNESSTAIKAMIFLKCRILFVCLFCLGFKIDYCTVKRIENHSKSSFKFNWRQSFFQPKWFYYEIFDDSKRDIAKRGSKVPILCPPLFAICSNLFENQQKPQSKFISAKKMTVFSWIQFENVSYFGHSPSSSITQLPISLVQWSVQSEQKTK